MKKKFQIYIIVIFVLTFGPFGVGATLQSDNYVIYENVMHTFDGPVISNVNHTVDGTSVTVTWNTNIVADSFVIYDTSNTFTTSKEAGSSAKTSTSHSVEITGLAANTNYYYHIKSTRVNGGVTTDNTERTFTSGAGATPPTPPASGGGGGLLIIDKTDKFAPEITNVTIGNITDKTAEISWTTNEDATSFVEYGPTVAYGSTQGRWSSSTAHTVILDSLKPATNYHFRALSSDGWGNVGRSGDNSFITKAGIPSEEEPETEEPGPGDEGNITTQTVIEFVRRIFPEITPGQLAPSPLDRINNAADVTRLIPSPILSGEPRVEVGATEVRIFWTTDIRSNSLVAIAPETAFKPGLREPYQMIVGDSEALVTEHEVAVYNLTPNTTYHFQVRSKANMGPMSTSEDYSFQTSIEELKITSFFSQIIDQQTASFKWVTNKEADATVKIAPYRNNVIGVDETKTYKDNTVAIIHEIKIGDLVGGEIYNVELSSMDDKGNVATEILDRFSTAADDFPPDISHIKADSTVFLDQSNKTQTIISWLTNEPGTSRIYYQEGVQMADAALSEQTNLNENYTKEHVMVITKFKPGIVYSFRVETIDSGGNVSLSKVHTFMTAKKKESIIQIILRILEETFSWMKKIG